MPDPTPSAPSDPDSNKAPLSPYVRSHLASAGRKGGQKTSESKTAANKQKALNGGRPKGSKDSFPRIRTCKKKTDKPPGDAGKPAK